MPVLSWLLVAGRRSVRPLVRPRIRPPSPLPPREMEKGAGKTEQSGPKRRGIAAIAVRRWVRLWSGLPRRRARQETGATGIQRPPDATAADARHHAPGPPAHGNPAKGPASKNGQGNAGRKRHPVHARKDPTPRRPRTSRRRPVSIRPVPARLRAHFGPEPGRPSPQSQSFCRRYGSRLPTSLTHIRLATRGC